MVVSAISRPGQINGAGSENALFLRLFSGEVLTEFHRLNKFMPLHMVKTISGGKSATFPVTGTASAKYHVAGESLFGTDNAQVNTYLNNIKTKEREIFVDDPVVAPVFTSRIDDLKVHWDHRRVYVEELGKALSEKVDNNIIRTILGAATATPSFNPMTIGEKTITIADATVGANIALFARKVAELFDTYNIPQTDRYLALRPKQYYALAGEKDLVNRDWTAGSNGDYAQSKVFSVSGLTVIMSTALGKTDERAAATGEKNDPSGSPGTGYGFNWSTIGALAFHRSAVGTVKMQDLAMTTGTYPDRLGDLIVASYIMGHGVLRPECAAFMSSTTI